MEAALGGPSTDHVEGVAAGSDVAAQRGALAVAGLALDHAPAPHRLIHLFQAARLAYPHLRRHTAHQSQSQHHRVIDTVTVETKPPEA